jgi:hypothetical protein
MIYQKLSETYTNNKSITSLLINKQMNNDCECVFIFIPDEE